MKKIAVFIFLFGAILIFNFLPAKAENTASPEKIMEEAGKIFNKITEREAVGAETDFAEKEWNHIGNFSSTAFRAREIFLGNSVVSEFAQKEKAEPAKENFVEKILGSLKNILNI